jgi:MFS family permease
VYSFLVRDNFFYQAFEHALLGCATGMGCAITIQDVLWTKWAIPMWDGFRGLATAGASSAALGGALLLIPGLIGVLWYFQFSKRYYWLSRIPLCIGLGAGAGMAFKNVLNQLLPQVTGTFKPLWVGESIVRDATTLARIGMSVENLIFVLGTISVLTYFFFAFGRSKYGVRAPAQLGRWYLMLSLGAFFGNTFMSRLSGLIERFGFLFSEWLKLT